VGCGGGKERNKSMIFPMLLLDTTISYPNRFLKFGNEIHNRELVCHAVIRRLSAEAHVRYVSCTVACH
jgi:hypothetical protein